MARMIPELTEIIVILSDMHFDREERKISAQGESCETRAWAAEIYVGAKCRSTLLIRIWILAFCQCNTLFFLLNSAKSILLLTLVVALRSSLPGIARYRLPGNCMKISLSLFSIFRLPLTRHLLRNQCWCG